MSKEIHFKRDVRVVVEVHNQSAPPKLLFSFPGLEDPVEIWDDLRQLGWEIPDRPPHPPPEIDWDAPEGSRYHVLPYRVEEFGITASRWPSFEVAERGLETINALRRFGVDLEVPVSYLDFLRRTQLELQQDPGRSRVRQRPARVPQALLLSKQPFSVLVDDDAIDVYETVTGPSQPNWYWVESKQSSDKLGSSEESQGAILSSVELGWELTERASVPLVLDGRDRTLRFIVRDLDDGAKMVDLITSLVGDTCSALFMQPIDRTGAFQNCLLVVAVVPRERFAEIGETIIKTFPDAIGRGRRFTALSNENAA